MNDGDIKAYLREARNSVLPTKIMPSELKSLISSKEIEIFLLRKQVDAAMERALRAEEILEEVVSRETPRAKIPTFGD